MNQESQNSDRSLGNRGGLRSTLTLAAMFMAGALLVILLSSQGDLLESGVDAPVFELEQANGSNRISLESLRGKVVLIDFWSTTCPPCLRQLRDLEAIHRQMDEQDFVIIGINAEGASRRTVEEFAEAHRIQYPMLVDSGEVTESYGVRTLPTLYLVDQNGKIHWSRVGYTPRQDLLEVMAKIPLSQMN